MHTLRHRISLVVLTGVLLCLGGLVQAERGTGWGHDPLLSWAAMEYSDGPVSLFVLPDGSGRAFDEAYAQWGAQVDAIITAELINMEGDPIVDYPAEDMWLEAEDGGLILCDLGSVADANTDPNGRTQWSLPLRAGGHSQAGCRVYIGGTPISYGPPLELYFNSADITGDLEVDLSDVAAFAHDFYLGYDYRSDFHWDGELNIADLGLLAQGLGVVCP